MEKIIVSLVGAGGKTTIMYELARLFGNKGYRILVSTTTHIRLPETGFAETEEAVRSLWKKGNYAVIGTPDQNTGKLTMPRPEFFEKMKKEADLVLLEADGAKRHPCKVPAAHEPVILPECNLVIGVMGMRAIGMPAAEVCFRLKEAGAWLGITPETILDEKLAAAILCSEQGTMKNVGNRRYVIVLSQCETPDAREKAEKIQREIWSVYRLHQPVLFRQGDLSTTLYELLIQ